MSRSITQFTQFPLLEERVGSRVGISNRHLEALQEHKSNNNDITRSRSGSEREREEMIKGRKRCGLQHSDVQVARLYHAYGTSSIALQHKARGAYLDTLSVDTTRSSLSSTMDLDSDMSHLQGDSAVVSSWSTCPLTAKHGLGPNAMGLEAKQGTIGSVVLD